MVSPARRPPPRADDDAVLRAQLAEDFAAFRTEQLNRTEADAMAAGVAPDPTLADAATATLRSTPPPRPADANPALLRLRALSERDGPPARGGEVATPAPAGRASWTPLAPPAPPDGRTGGDDRIPTSGRVTAIAPHPADPARIWIGTGRGGVWRTDDGAVTWRPLTDDQPSLAIGAVAVGTDDPEVLYAGTGEGNVQPYSSAYPRGSAPGVYLGAGVLRSADGGATWTSHAAPLLAGACFYRLAVDRTDADRAFGATSRGLIRTTDGVNWALLTGGGLPSLSADVIACCDVVIDQADPSGNTVYAAFWGSGIYRSTDALATSPTFTRSSEGLPAAAAVSRISLGQSPSHPPFVYALLAGADGNPSGLYRCTVADASSWELCTASSSIRLSGTFTHDVAVDPADPDVVYVSGESLYRCVRTSGGGWRVTDVGGAIPRRQHTVAFHPARSEVLYAGNDGGFFMSPDAGASWDGRPNAELGLHLHEIVDPDPVTDGLLTGEALPGVALAGMVGRISARSSAADSVIWCATTSGQVYQLTRSASAWRVQVRHGPPLPAGQWIGDVAGVPGTDDAVVVAFGGFGLADHLWRGEVTAAGETAWRPVSTGLPDVPVYALCLASATEWYVGTDIGVWRSADGGQRWEPWSPGLPNTAVHHLRLHPGGTRLRAATRGRGMWEIDTSTGVRPCGGRRR